MLAAPRGDGEAECGPLCVYVCVCVCVCPGCWLHFEVW
jgi:hypothetical protein